MTDGEPIIGVRVNVQMASLSPHILFSNLVASGMWSTRTPLQLSLPQFPALVGTTGTERIFVSVMVEISNLRCGSASRVKGHGKASSIYAADTI